MFMQQLIEKFSPFLFGRGVYLLLAFVCHEFIVTALYFQYVVGLEPCPLCTIQRIIIIFLGGIFAVAALHGPGKLFARIYNGLALTLGICGIGVAWRHVWLQHLPKDQVPDCGPGLDYIMDTLPFLDALANILKGSGECAEVAWSFLGISMAEWMLPIFIGFVSATVFLIWVQKYRQD
jgi:disulfide bond formation protein DsbB